MMNNNHEDLVSKILEKISQESIMQFYFPEPIHLGTKYRNPFRNDTNPDCSFFYGKNKTLFFKDFATGKVYNCFHICIKKNNDCDFKTALRIINKDFNLGLFGPNNMGNLTEKISEKDKNENKPIIDIEIASRLMQEYQEQTIIKVMYKRFNKEDLDFFKQGGITEKTLKIFNVKAANYCWLNDVLYHQYSLKEPMYAYKESKDKFKIYRPKSSKKNKFRSNYTSDMIEGYNQLPPSGETLFIVKSKKDIMVLHELKLISCSFISETVVPNPYKILELKERFKRIIVWYDNDSTGVENSKYLNAKFEFEYFNIPINQPKDPFDFVKSYGQYSLLEILRNKNKIK